MKVLLTGGTGYIASHTAVELFAKGDEVILVDDLANSRADVVEKIAQISGKKPKFYEADVRDYDKLREILACERPDAVIHFAGLKAVGESVAKPLEYYDNNLISTLKLLAAMRDTGVKNLIFSSSATVYGDPEELPLKETSRTGVGITNPYGWTKYMIEQILMDFSRATPDFNVTILRYFNPIGAHASGVIGENPNGIPNNLLPFVAQVAVGIRPELKIFGGDYDTPDGTCLRDYIHVVDLAKGHVAALAKMSGLRIYNLGSGRGVSVLEIVQAFERATGVKIPYEIVDRRAGDVPRNYSSAQKAFDELGWKTELSVEGACRDAWNFQQKIAS